MNIRRFFLLSLALAVLALGLQFTAMSQRSHGLHMRVQAITGATPNRMIAKAEADRHSQRAAVLGYIGLAFALASAALGILSARRQEPARRSVVLGTLLAYLLLQFVLI